MRIALGCDHGGFNLKQAVIDLLEQRDIEIVDSGCFDANSVDYPDIALAVGEKVSTGDCEKGILICGTGIGIAIAANKVKGIRAAVCHSVNTASLASEHNAANVLTFGGRVVDEATAVEMVKAWLDTEFGGERHQKRIDKITDIENKYFK